MEKKSFLIYLDYEEQFNLLSDEESGQLIKAIIKYEKTGQEPELTGVLKMAFSFIKTQLDRDREKWEDKKSKRSEAGKKGMASRWSKDNASEDITADNNVTDVITNDNKNNNVINAITKITNITDNVEVKEDVDVKVKDNKKEKKKKRKTFEDVFNEKSVSDRLEFALKDFIDMRKTIKKPMTSKALELLINKLRNLSNSEIEQIEILNTSIEHGWQSVYPLKEGFSQKSKKGSMNDFKELMREAIDEQNRDDTNYNIASW